MLRANCVAIWQNRVILLQYKMILRMQAEANLDYTMARVLLAEDDFPVRAFVRKALEMDGHQVVEAEDGGLALDLLGVHQGHFDLLLSDIRMPVMDGIALALGAARDYPDLPILLMTGYADQRERASELNAIVEDVITKPFTLAELRELVSHTLEKRRKAA